MTSLTQQREYLKTQLIEILGEPFTSRKAFSSNRMAVGASISAI